MKNYKYIKILSFIFIMAFTRTGLSQINFNSSFGSGIIIIDGVFDQYLPGFQIRSGLTVDGEIPLIQDLMWESGIEFWFGKSKFYQLERGSHEVSNGHYPLDKSQKLSHLFWNLEIPIRLRYNAFGFMGLIAGMNLSFLIDRKVYIPSIEKNTHMFFGQKFITTGEAGLFFPVNNRIRIDVKAYRTLDVRFYRSQYTDQNGKIQNGDGYNDYGFLVNMAYRLNK